LWLITPSTRCSERAPQRQHRSITNVDPRTTICLPSVGILLSDFGTVVGMDTCSRHLQNTRIQSLQVGECGTVWCTKSSPNPVQLDRTGTCTLISRDLCLFLWRSGPLCLLNGPAGPCVLCRSVYSERSNKRRPSHTPDGLLNIH
jgi:hypothetical protein